MVAHEKNMNLHTKFQSLKQRHFQIISQTPEEVFNLISKYWELAIWTIISSSD